MTPLTPKAMLATLQRARISHLIVVPDTVQKTFLSAAATAPWLRMHTVCTEDEALGINAGLYVAGHRPLLSIQNNGFYACLNTVRGIALDAAVPTVMLIGQFGAKPGLPPEQSPSRMVRMLKPTLATWEIPHVELRSDADLTEVPARYDEAFEERRPLALIVPVVTA